MNALEIGVFPNLATSGSYIKYICYLNSEELVARANFIIREISTIPQIDYVLPGISLQHINEDFDAVVSSYVIEHQSDVIDHMKNVEKLIKKNGRRLFCWARLIMPACQLRSMCLLTILM
jgi:hypothetical protein